MSETLHAVNGNWHLPANSKTIPDPYNGDEFVKVPDPQVQPHQHASVYHACLVPVLLTLQRMSCMMTGTVTQFPVLAERRGQ